MGRRASTGRLRTSSSVTNNINDLSEEDDALIRLHEILFGMPGSKSMRKKNVLGWSFSESQRRSDAIKVAICATPELTVLKEICVMLDIDLPAGRPAIEASLFDFLTNLVPTADGGTTIEKIKFYIIGGWFTNA